MNPEMDLMACYNWEPSNLKLSDWVRSAVTIVAIWTKLLTGLMALEAVCSDHVKRNDLLHTGEDERLTSCGSIKTLKVR